jgi:hypothetical protein
MMPSGIKSAAFQHVAVSQPNASPHTPIFNNSESNTNCIKIVTFEYKKNGYNQYSIWKGGGPELLFHVYQVFMNDF